MDPAAAVRDGQLRQAAEAFEAVFLTEMLKHTGVGAPRETLGGGAGEQAFSTFLVEEYADLMARQGGIGLADQIYADLKARIGDVP
jgi:Rod binding domain-containing protein